MFRTDLRDSFVMKYLTMAILSSVAVIVYWFPVGRVNKIGDFAKISELQGLIRLEQLVSTSVMAGAILVAYVIGIRSSFKDRKRDKASLCAGSAAVLGTLGGLYFSTLLLAYANYPFLGSIDVGGFWGALITVVLALVLAVWGSSDQRSSLNSARMTLAFAAAGAHILIVTGIGYSSCASLMTLK